MVNGTQIDPAAITVREEINGWFSLIIDGADNMASGLYKCGVGQYQSDEAYLRVECKPERAEVRLLPDRRIEIQMNTVFPVPKINFKLTDGTFKDTPISFHYPNCSGYRWLQDCTWISSTTVGNGRHGYILTASTLTETAFIGNIN